MAIFSKKGNSKIDKSCLIFSLPTNVCNGEGKQCKGCYALKAERMYKHTLPSRTRNYELSLNSSKFVDEVKSILASTKKWIIRVHESGDFYSQDYIDSWVKIASLFPDKQFYAYTKKKDVFNFESLENLSNWNLIDSKTPIGFNYGDKEYVKKLEALGYFVCPHGTDKRVVCMGNCFACLVESKIAFLKH